jgi:hypothetical protein
MSAWGIQKAHSGTATPLLSEMTLLSVPFLSKGRNEFIVSIGPRTLVTKEVLKSTPREGLKDIRSEEKPYCITDPPTYKD